MYIGRNMRATSELLALPYFFLLMPDVGAAGTQTDVGKPVGSTNYWLVAGGDPALLNRTTGLAGPGRTTDSAKVHTRADRVCICKSDWR